MTFHLPPSEDASLLFATLQDAWFQLRKTVFYCSECYIRMRLLLLMDKVPSLESLSDVDAVAATMEIISPLIYSNYLSGSVHTHERKVHVVLAKLLSLAKEGR